MKNKLTTVGIILGLLFLINGCGSTDSGPNSEIRYQVSVTASPEEGGTVEPANGEYEEGTSLDITAKPSEGWRFDHWEGDHDGSSSSATITVEQDMEITGVFVQKEYKLTVTIEGEGIVDEKVVTKTKDYKDGTVVELTANPSEGYRFVEWKGAATGSENPVLVTMNGAKEVTAVFQKKNYALNIVVEGQGAVSEEVIKAKSYEHGTVVELTANPSEGYKFVEWKGIITSVDNPVQITVDAPKELTAVFESLFAGGDGTEANPYQIATLEQLQNVSKYLEAYYIQTNDIDVSATATGNAGKGFMPIGDENNPFKGSFNGNGYTISNLTINRKNMDYVGLFGYVEPRVFISNIKLENVNITGKAYTGGLIGYRSISWNMDYAVYDSYVTGKVTCFGSNCGGMFGGNGAHVVDSYADVDVTSSHANVGGLIGQSGDLCDIIRSYALGNVSGTGNSVNVGGLVGNNYSDIENSYAQGKVSGKSRVGGLVGLTSINSDILFSYATGKVQATTSSGSVGGLVGRDNYNPTTIKNSYWDVETTGQSQAIGVIYDSDFTVTSSVVGFTTSEMTGTAAQANMANFDFGSIWRTVPNEYPVLF